MSTLYLPMLRLERLRRSVRLAALVLAVFVLRIGMVAACIPSDLAELAETGGHIEAADHSEAASGIGESEASIGHCTHCACHHAVTFFESHIALPSLRIAAAVDSPPVPQSSAPQDLSLRPPIV